MTSPADQSEYDRREVKALAQCFNWMSMNATKIRDGKPFHPDQVERFEALLKETFAAYAAALAAAPSPTRESE